MEITYIGTLFSLQFYNSLENQILISRMIPVLILKYFLSSYMIAIPLKH